MKKDFVIDNEGNFLYKNDNYNEPGNFIAIKFYIHYTEFFDSVSLSLSFVEEFCFVYNSEW